LQGIPSARTGDCDRGDIPHIAALPPDIARNGRCLNGRDLRWPAIS